uniref:Tetraspanin n=1 Tax=Schistosoma mansoni TaxID=6183 RepID=A0A5K4F3T7_SCHMA
MACGYKCLKILLVIFNILIFACGIALIVIGSLSRIAINNYSSGIDSNIKNLVIFVISLGCFLFLLGFFGFCGLSTENTCCLIVYTVLLSVMVAAEIAAGIAAVALKKDVKTQFLSSVKSSVSEYDNNPDLKIFLDKIQQEFQCCGSESSNDYTSVGQTIPDSCKNPTTKVIYSNGCLNKVIFFLEKYIVAVSATTFAVAILQLSCVVFSVCVIRATKSGDSYYD